MDVIHQGIILEARNKMRFELVDLIARGGMSEVWRAVNLSVAEGGLDRFVAVKILDSIQLGSANTEFGWNMIQRFETEGKLVQDFNHPNIIRFVAAGNMHELPFLVTELHPGMSLDAFILKRIESAYRDVLLVHDSANSMGARRMGPEEAGHKMLHGVLFPYDTVIRTIMGSLLRGLARAHEGSVCHRDMKPENVMLIVEDGKPDRIKIMDFGIAKVMDERRASEICRATTGTQALLGTPMYMSPEQFRSSTNVGPQTDVYAAGLILFELMTGLRPFAGATTWMQIVSMIEAVRHRDPSEYIEHSYDAILPHLSAVVCKATDQSPQRRYANAGEMLEAFEEAFRRGVDDVGRPEQRYDPYAQTIVPVANPATPPVEVAPSSRVPVIESDESPPPPPRPEMSRMRLILIALAATIFGAVAFLFFFGDSIESKNVKSIAVVSSTPERVASVGVATLKREPMSDTVRNAYKTAQLKPCTKNSVELLELALKQSPGVPELHEALAKCDRKRGRVPSALRHETAARELRSQK